jgi:hypothetical protein
MIPSSMLGGLVLLTSLAAPEADQNQKRDEVRIELLACITRISSALKVKLRQKFCAAKFSAVAGHSCQLARQSTNATPRRSQKQLLLRFACAQYLCLLREKRLRSGSLPGLGRISRR